MKKINIFLLFTMLLFCCVHDADAQSKKKSSNTKSQPTEKKSTVIVFGDDDEDNIEDSEKGKTKKKHSNIIVKTSPGSFIFGQQMLEVEKEINSVVSVQVGAGATFKNILGLNNDFLSILSDLADFESTYDESPNFDSQDDIYDNYSTDKKVVPGLHLSASTRFFVDAGGFEDSYIAPTFTYKTINVNTPGIVDGQSFVAFDPKSMDRETKKIMNVSIRYGNQYIYDSNITAEWFLGLGLGFIKDTKQDLGYRNQIVVREFQTISRTRFLYELGLRFGYFF